MLVTWRSLCNFFPPKNKEKDSFLVHVTVQNTFTHGILLPATIWAHHLNHQKMHRCHIVTFIIKYKFQLLGSYLHMLLNFCWNEQIFWGNMPFAIFCKNNLIINKFHRKFVRDLRNIFFKSMNPRWKSEVADSIMMHDECKWALISKVDSFKGTNVLERSGCLMSKNSHV